MDFKNCSISLIILKLLCIYALDNGLARSPPMGWNHWIRFGCNKDCENQPNECVSELLIKRQADLLVSEGYAAVGYDYVIIDDCWYETERDPLTQKLVPDKRRFPSGMSHLADYIHKKGLKIGLFHIYHSKSYEELDVKTFADWGIDYIKLIAAWGQLDLTGKMYTEFGRNLKKSGRPIVYSCSWAANLELHGKIPNYEDMKSVCNLWRNWYGIRNNYESLTSVMDFFSKNQQRIQPHGGPGHWNDPDVLILGNSGLNLDQCKQQMAIWAILAAPLIMSNDLAVIRPEIKKILQNCEIIEINQDPLGIQGKRLLTKDGIEVWRRPVMPFFNNGLYSYAVAFLNRRDDNAPYTVRFNIEELELYGGQKYEVRDLFDGLNKGTYNSTDVFETRINFNGVNFYSFEILLN